MQRIAPVHTEHCPITFRAYLWKSWSSAFRVLELCFWGQKAVLLSSKSSAFAIKKWCTRCLKAMLLKAKRHAFGILENALLFSIVYKYSKTSFAPSKNGHRSQVWPCVLSAPKTVTGHRCDHVTFGHKTVTGHRCDHVTFGHKGGMKTPNAECKQRR